MKVIGVENNLEDTELSSQSDHDAEQARITMLRMLNSEKPDPLEILRLNKILEGPDDSPPAYAQYVKTDIRMINGSSEEGVLHSLSFSIFKEEIANNKDYQDIEAQLDVMRNSGDPAVFDSQEFQDLLQNRRDIEDGLQIISMHKAEEQVGIKLEDANQEIGSGQHLYEQNLPFSLTEIDASDVKVVLDASTEFNSDGKELSASDSLMISTAQDELRQALENLEVLHSDPAADPDELAAAEATATFAYVSLYDKSVSVGVYGDYYEAKKTLENQVEGREPSVFDVLGDDVVAQGDQSLMIELQETGVLSANIISQEMETPAAAVEFSNKPLQL